jgi:hypothetical protein
MYLRSQLVEFIVCLSTENRSSAEFSNEEVPKKIPITLFYFAREGVQEAGRSGEV